MVTIRRSTERGHFNHGWLETYHTFSFADYRDARFMGFRSLRVINEDFVAPGQGFGEHPHRDMEIITYVLKGELAHKDSLGNGAIIRPGDVQYMAAGTGIEHSEFNPSRTDPVHLMQIWIFPDRKGITPQYEQRRFPALPTNGSATPQTNGSSAHASSGALTLLASADGRAGSIKINQDANVLAAALQAGQTANYALASGRGAWIQILRGEIQLDGQTLTAGDGASIENQPSISIAAAKQAELLLFDVR